MKSYLSLIPISSKINNRQNRMTILCIIFAVFLVTTIFSMAELGVRMEFSRLVDKHNGLSINELLNNTMVQSLFIIASILFVLVLIAGVLMISSSINSNVAQRTSFFGMMRCIGMSKKQIIKFVTLESLNWCKKAIPIGLILGIIVTWVLSFILHYFVGNEFSNMPLFGFSIIGNISGIIIGLVTVLIGARTPAKKASKVSPIAAVSGNIENTIKNNTIITNNFFKIERLLGINHAISIKKNFILIASSFALSIILFLSFSVFIDFISYIMPQNSNASDINISSIDNQNSIDSDLIYTINKMNGVKNVFGRRNLSNVSAKIGNQNNYENIDIISYDKFDLDSLVKDSLLKKGSDISKIYGDSNYILTIWDEDSNLKIDDIISIANNEFKIGGFLKYNPFSEDGSVDGNMTVISSSEAFTKLTGIKDYSLINIQTEKDIKDDDVNKIENIVSNKYKFQDKRDQRTTGVYIAFMLFTYGFLGIIALVTILNIINNISMSVTARIKQYGIMRAVGMDNIKMRKMILSEAFTYALSGCILGICIGLYINKFIYEKLITSHFSYAIWKFPIISILIILLFVFSSVILSAYIPIKRIKNMEVTDIINEL